MTEMNEEEYFGGRLKKRSLAVYEGAPPIGAAGPKRLRLAQGELASIYDEVEGIRYIAFVELVEGMVRGNHVHRVKNEHFYLIRGKVVLGARPVEGGELVMVEMEAGDLAVIRPGIAHGIKPLEDGEGIEFAPEKFDGADSEKVAVI